MEGCFFESDPVEQAVRVFTAVSREPSSGRSMGQTPGSSRSEYAFQKWMIEAWSLRFNHRMARRDAAQLNDRRSVLFRMASSFLLSFFTLDQKTRSPNTHMHILSESLRVTHGLVGSAWAEIGVPEYYL